MISDTFSLYFSQLQDPRQTTKISYRLFDVIFLTVCAVIGGAKGWEDIEYFGQAHLLWFHQRGILLEGVPVHDTIARIISRLNPEAFRRCFIDWMQTINERTEGELIAIDGKVLRGSYSRENRQSVICMVNAFATANGVVIGQLKINEKSNEITGIPELLRLLDIKGCLISLDAIGCQTEIAKTIVQQGGDYLLTVKRNQKTLFEAVRKAFTIALTKKLDVADVNIEKGHGRIETRVYHVIPAGELTRQFPEWKNLKSIGVAINYRIEKSGKDSLE